MKKKELTKEQMEEVKRVICNIVRAYTEIVVVEEMKKIIKKRKKK